MDTHVWVIGIVVIPLAASLWQHFHRVPPKQELRYGSRTVLIFGVVWSVLWILGGLSIMVEQGGLPGWEGTPIMLFWIAIGVIVVAVIVSKNLPIHLKRRRLLRNGTVCRAEVIQINYSENISMKYGGGLRFRPVTVSVRYPNAKGNVVVAESNRIYSDLPDSPERFEALVYRNPADETDVFIQVFYLSEEKSEHSRDG